FTNRKLTFSINRHCHKQCLGTGVVEIKELAAAWVPPRTLTLIRCHFPLTFPLRKGPNKNARPATLPRFIGNVTPVRRDLRAGQRSRLLEKAPRRSRSVQRQNS